MVQTPFHVSAVATADGLAIYTDWLRDNVSYEAGDAFHDSLTQGESGYSDGYGDGDGYGYGNGYGDGYGYGYGE